MNTPMEIDAAAVVSEKNKVPDDPADLEVSTPISKFQKAVKKIQIKRLYDSTNTPKKSFINNFF